MVIDLLSHDDIREATRFSESSKTTSLAVIYSRIFVYGVKSRKEEIHRYANLLFNSYTLLSHAVEYLK